MQARFLLALVVLLLPLSLIARTPDHIEVFGGYSHLNYYVYPPEEGPWTELGYNGFEAATAFRLLLHLAAETDFGFENGPGTDGKIQTYLGGRESVSASEEQTSMGTFFSVA